MSTLKYTVTGQPSIILFWFWFERISAHHAVFYLSHKSVGSRDPLYLAVENTECLFVKLTITLSLIA